jgi:hypothetical protein
VLVRVLRLTRAYLAIMLRSVRGNDYNANRNAIVGSVSTINNNFKELLNALAILL